MDFKNEKVMYNKYNKINGVNKKNTDHVEMQGVVIQCVSNGMFRVKLENNFVVLVYISGKIRCNFIQIILGDRVLVELSPYDLTRGRITYRFKSAKKK